MYLILKFTLSAAVIVAISELARFSPRLGGLVASLPLVSLLGMWWLYVDTRSAQAVAALSREIFWLVLPSLVLFIALPWLIKRGLSFYPAIAVSLGLMLAAYGGTLVLLRRLGAGAGDVS